MSWRRPVEGGDNNGEDITRDPMYILYPFERRKTDDPGWSHAATNVVTKRF